jgi:hypothetical protein
VLLTKAFGIFVDSSEMQGFFAALRMTTSQERYFGRPKKQWKDMKL